jgi:hypothetical protein
VAVLARRETEGLIMLRTARLLLFVAALGMLPPAPAALAQAPQSPAADKDPAPAPAAPPAVVSTPDLLRNLPRLPETPTSLYAPPEPPHGPMAPPPPYFEMDPLLDPPPLPLPGPFAAVEVGVLVPHVKNGLIDTVSVGDRNPDLVALPSAPLDWTGAPRFEVGWRLPSGFGEFVLGYRFFNSDGRGVIAGPDGPAGLRSRVALNVADLTYASREISLWPNWDMKWMFGLRYASVYFDSQAAQPFDQADAGTGILTQRVTNRYVGFGPHAGLELARRWPGTGLELAARVDLTTLLGRIRQGFFETTTDLGPTGEPLGGQDHQSGSQSVPVVNVRAGLTWQPPDRCFLRLFLGYEYEYWWNVGRNSNTGSRGEMSDQGVLLRAEVDF